MNIKGFYLWFIAVVKVIEKFVRKETIFKLKMIFKLEVIDREYRRFQNS